MPPSNQQTAADADGARFRAVLTLGSWTFLILGVLSLIRSAALQSASAGLPWNWLESAMGWWVALGFVGLNVGMGNRLLELLEGKQDFLAGISRMLVAFLVGFWLFSLVLMGLAGAGALNAASVGALVVVSAVLATWPLAESCRSLRGILFPTSWKGPGSSLLLVLVVLLIFLPYLIRSLLPDSDWDGASTHLPLADWLLNHGLSEIPLALSNMAIPGTVHLVYAAFLAVGAGQAIIPLNLIMSLMTCLAAAAIGERFWGKKAAGWAFGVCLSVNLILELGLDSRIDSTLAFFCTMGAFGLMVWLLEDRGPLPLMVSGIALGLALGTKYTAIFPVALWSLPVLWTLIRKPESRQGNHGLGVLVAVFFLLIPSGYWYLANLVRYGDPIYPLVGGQVLRLRDGSTVSEAEAIGSLMDRARAAGAVPEVPDSSYITRPPYDPPRSMFNPVSIFAHPERHGRKPAHTVSPLLLLFFALPLIRRDRAGWVLFALGASLFMALGSQTFLLRYGILVFPLLAVGAGALLSGLESGWWRGLGALALAGVLGWNLWAEWKILPDFQPGSWLVGRENRLGWLSEVGYNSRTEMPRAIRDIHSLQASGKVSRDGKVLMIGEAKGWLLGMETIPDITRTARPWLARLARNDGNLDAVHRDLWDEGVRYVLVNLGYFQWVRENMVVDIDELIFSLHSIEQFNRARGEIVPLSDENMILVRLHPPTGARG